MTVPCLEDVLEDCTSDLDAETIADLQQQKTERENLLACAESPKVIVSYVVIYL